MIPIPVAVLARTLRLDESEPIWPDRDRVIITEDYPDLPGALRLPAQWAAAAALGMASAERMIAQRFGRSLVDHRTWLICGAGALSAGPAQEAWPAAGEAGLGRLSVLAVLNENETVPRWLAAMGWTVRMAQDAETLGSALSAAMRAHKPTFIAWQGGPGLADMPALRGGPARRGWLKRLRRHASGEVFTACMAGRLPRPFPAGFTDAARPRSQSTMEAVRTALAALAPVAPEIVVTDLGLSAGGAAMGMALHGGLLPVGMDGLCAGESALPAMRQAARSGAALLLLLDESDDCPLGGLRAGWRAMRAVTTYRPADAPEAVECLGLALRGHGPCVLLLSPHPVPPLAAQTGRHPGRGGYLLQSPKERDVTLVASGPELHLAIAAAAALAERGLQAAIVSLPCWNLFLGQEEEYRAEMIGSAPCFGIECGTGLGYERLLGPAGVFLDCTGLDANALAERVERRLQRSPAILENSPELLESRLHLD